MGLRRMLLVLVACSCAALPARAVTVGLDFFALWSNDPEPSVTVFGGGSFTASDRSQLGLGDLSSFTFSWQTIGGGNDPSPVFNAGLSDLVSFSASISGGRVTALALKTRLITSPQPAEWAAELFTVSSLAQNGAYTNTGLGQPEPGSIGIGTARATIVTGAGNPTPVPEPSSLALFAVACTGLGLLRGPRRSG